MYHSERRTLYRFLAIYLLSTFILFAMGSAIFYAYEKHHLIDKQEAILEIESDRLYHHLTLLHHDFSNSLPLPNREPFDVALFETKHKLIFASYDVPRDIKFEKNLSIKDGYIYHLRKIEPYYLGVAYLVMRMPIDYNKITDLKKMLAIFMLIAGFFFLIIGYFLGRLFIAPMREAIDMMNSFIQDTTHELNTPISTILANLELINTLQKCNAPEEMRRIEIASKRLSRIYDDLTYLKLNHEYHREIQAINLSTFIEERILYFATDIEYKKLTLYKDIQSDVLIDIDRDDAMRLIDNLISNAIKYNEKLGILRITLTNKQFTIKDGGIGIDSGELDTLFDRFKRANRSEGGFGIGLNIVYQITQVYGFDISIESQLNIGTKVTISW